MSRGFRARRTALAAASVVATTAMLPAPADAATHTVCASGCDHTTIQAAVNAASPGDLILVSDPYHTEADIVVGKNLEIAGVGTPKPVVQAASAPGTAGLRILEVMPNSIVTIRDLVLRHGQDFQGGGGAIRNNGILTLRRVEITDNESFFSGGAVGSHGPLVIEDSVIARNLANIGGGGVECLGGCSSLEIHRSHFEANSTPVSGQGGGLFSTAPTVITSTEFRGNVGGANGLGGGAIHLAVGSGTVLVLDSLFIDNSANGGGAIFSQALLTMVGCTFEDNLADSGGALFHLSPGRAVIEGSLFQGNSAAVDGGAIYENAPGTVIRGSTFRFNSAGVSSASGVGGALRTTGGALIEDSVFHGNVASDDGGAIFGAGGATDLSIRNTTVSGNQADDRGGGLYLAGDASLSSVTITDNDADLDASSGADGGGIAVISTATVDIRNSIIAGNRDGSPNPLLRAVDCVGPISVDGPLHLGTLGTVLLEPACLVSGETPDLGGDPGLGPLADHGGPTATHALLPGSQNVDAGDPSGCSDETGALLHLDQRGAERIGSCDRGAFELGGEPALFRDGFESGGVWAWLLGD